MADTIMSTSSSIVLAVVLGGVFLLWWRHSSSSWRGPPTKSGARIPKGSFGWPIIGETIALTTNPETYATSHVKRYGKIFKSSILLRKAIIGTTPAFAKFVLSNTNLFRPDVPESMANVLGPKALNFELVHARHMSVKKIALKALAPDALRTEVNTLETIILENMASWEERGTIVGNDGAQKISLETALWMVLGLRDMGSTPEGQKALTDLNCIGEGLVSLPVNIPGTAFYKGLKARADLNKYLKRLMQQRRGLENTQADMIGVLLAALKDPQVREEMKDFDEDMIADNLVASLFAAYETTSTTLTWVLKLLVDYPDVFRRVQAEQQEILKDRDTSTDGPRLSWEDIRKMVYTQKVFQELQRFVSTANLVFRAAKEDAEYEGHLIPKGWTILLILPSLNRDPELYPDPRTFNPDRFDVTPKPYTYLPFGGGSYKCPGVDMAKLITLIYIHHLTTTYTYQPAGPDRGIEYNSLPTPVGGYPINIRRAK